MLPLNAILNMSLYHLAILTIMPHNCESDSCESEWFKKQVLALAHASLGWLEYGWTRLRLDVLGSKLQVEFRFALYLPSSLDQQLSRTFPSYVQRQEHKGQVQLWKHISNFSHRCPLVTHSSKQVTRPSSRSKGREYSLCTTRSCQEWECIIKI